MTIQSIRSYQRKDRLYYPLIQHTPHLLVIVCRRGQHLVLSKQGPLNMDTLIYIYNIRREATVLVNNKLKGCVLHRGSKGHLSSDSFWWGSIVIYFSFENLFIYLDPNQLRTCSAILRVWYPIWDIVLTNRGMLEGSLNDALFLHYLQHFAHIRNF